MINTASGHAQAPESLWASKDVPSIDNEQRHVATYAAAATQLLSQLRRCTITR
jgi:hypothetical protein